MVFGNGPTFLVLLPMMAIFLMIKTKTYVHLVHGRPATFRAVMGCGAKDKKIRGETGTGRVVPLVENSQSSLGYVRRICSNESGILLAGIQSEDVLRAAGALDAAGYLMAEHLQNDMDFIQWGTDFPTISLRVRINLQRAAKSNALSAAAAE